MAVEKKYLYIIRVCFYNYKKVTIFLFYMRNFMNYKMYVCMYIVLQQAICSHGRAYLLFTESLISNKINCMFRAYQWNLTYEG